MMMYNGKKVYGIEEFKYSEAKIGDYVTQEVVDDAMDCLPPACMRSDCSQMGEPYSMKKDPDTGKWRNVYNTFKRVEKKVWEYCGHCFRGENVERGEEMPIV